MRTQIQKLYVDTETKVIRGHKIKSCMRIQNQKLYEYTRIKIFTSTKKPKARKYKSYMTTQNEKLHEHTDS